MVIADRVAALGRGAHRHLLPLVVAAYALAAVAPAAGHWARRCALVEVGGTDITAPMALLAVLLFNAGIGASAADLGAVARRPRAVLAGVAANLVVPLAFLAVLAAGLAGWHDAVEAADLLAGL